jgi:WD40 repeat protein
MKQKEIWVDLEEYRPDIYSISNYGKIKNKVTNKILKTRITPYGYEAIEFGARPRTLGHRAYIHRLVYQAFNPNINIRDYDIHHIDEDKLNNYIGNLEKIKKGEHCSQHAKKRIGTRSPNFKGTVAAFDKEMEKHNFWHGPISNVISGRNKSYKGYIFKRLPNDIKLKIGNIYNLDNIL